MHIVPLDTRETTQDEDIFFMIVELWAIVSLGTWAVQVMMMMRIKRIIQWELMIF
jgi:hypothetical protein